MSAPVAAWQIRALIAYWTSRYAHTSWWTRSGLRDRSTRPGVKVRFDRAVERAGLADVIPHDLRATHGTWVADSHGVMVAARRLGHSNASVTTRHYARAVDGRDAEVATFLDERRRPARPDSPGGNG